MLKGPRIETTDGTCRIRLTKCARGAARPRARPRLATDLRDFVTVPPERRFRRQPRGARAPKPRALCSRQPLAVRRSRVMTDHPVESGEVDDRTGIHPVPDDPPTATERVKRILL